MRIKEIEFEEELRHNGMRAWFGSAIKFCLESFITFKHGERDRMAKCRWCNVMIPKQVPRIYIRRSCSSKTGYYCLDCASKLLERQIQHKEELKSDLDMNIRDLRTIKNVIDHARQKEKYKDYMATGVLCTKLEPELEPWRS